MVTCSPRLAARFPLMTDEEVVVYARAGHTSAVDYLMTKYRPLVESKARFFFLAGADAEDVIQEGMIGLYKAIRDYRTDRVARFRAFADLCVTRQIITAVKSATRQKHSLLNDSVPLYGTGNDADSDTPLIDTIPDSQAEDPAMTVARQRETAELYEAVYRILSALEAAVLEGYLAGDSYIEISRKLDCGTKCIDNALQRVKRKIAYVTEALGAGSFC